MSSVRLDGFSAPWAPDPSGLWTLTATPPAGAFEGAGPGMRIVAAAGVPADPAPYAEQHFAPALDLRGAHEIRLWLRSTRPADGSPGRPFYLSFEATTDPPGPHPQWHRLLPVSRADAWELHRLWLGDMPPALRAAVGFLRLRSLDPTVAFRADLAELLAVRPEPIADVDAALLERLDGVYAVRVAGVPTSVPAVVDVPEAAANPAAPYLLVTPWSVLQVGRRGGATELVDNYVETGACIRPAPFALQLEYRLDAVVQDRAQKTVLLEGALADLALRRLVVANVPLELVPFQPPAEEIADLVAPGRTPLFYRLVTDMEAGPRSMHEQADPFLVSGPLGAGAAPAEVVTV
jgi:hypothetical protein